MKSVFSIHDQNLSQNSYEDDYFRFLVDLTDQVASADDLRSLVERCASLLHVFFGIDYVSLEVYDSTKEKLHSHSVTFDSPDNFTYDNSCESIHTSLAEKVLRLGKKVLFTQKAIISALSDYHSRAHHIQQKLQAIYEIPLVSSGQLLGVLAVGSFIPCVFSPEISRLLDKVCTRLAMALDVIMIHDDEETLFHTDQSSANIPIKLYHDENSIYDGGLCGKDPAIIAILKQIEIVASSNATVLLQGETGTGKSFIAQRIHNLSSRCNHEMIRMNCTAIPADLMESELFGHEKGAFTGAQNRRIGHFELAHNSTLFLDEIGDMPIELQPKLLSVLQEHQIRRLGNAQITPVDVRVIAATNCDLKQKIEQKTFRSDLFYRLNVFPITLPPLRERINDIPLLAKFFTARIAKEMGKTITEISAQTIETMCRMPWYGNIRELQNVIERAVILTNNSTVLNLSPEKLSNYATSFDSSHQISASAKILEPTLSDIPKADRESMISALKACHGIIGGKNGAAAMIGLKRTTFLARLKRLNISAEDYRHQ